MVLLIFYIIALEGKEIETRNNNSSKVLRKRKKKKNFIFDLSWKL